MRVAAPALALALLAPEARADDKQACVDAYTQGQAARDQMKLLTARDKFRACAVDACAPVMQGVMLKQCLDWMTETNKRIPSVVFVAKRGGEEVIQATVAVDGVLTVKRLDGRAFEFDPGAHVATFLAPDGARVDVPFTAIEGVKAKVVSAEFPAPAAPPPPQAAPPPPPPPAQQPVYQPPPPQPAPTQQPVYQPPPPPQPGSPPAGAASQPAPPPPPEGGAEPHGFELGVRIGYALPSGTEGVVNGQPPNTPLGDDLSSSVPFGVEAGFRIDPHILIGAYFEYAVLSLNEDKDWTACKASGVSCGANDAIVGFQVAYHSHPRGLIDWWGSVGIGYEVVSTHASGPGGTANSNFNGPQYLNLQFGLDFRVSSSLGLGPYVGSSFDQFSSCSFSGSLSNGASCKITSGSMHEWYSFGARAVFDFGH
jgi:hypothetical protein